MRRRNAPRFGEGSPKHEVRREPGPDSPRGNVERVHRDEWGTRSLESESWVSRHRSNRDRGRRHLRSHADVDAFSRQAFGPVRPSPSDVFASEASERSPAHSLENERFGAHSCAEG